MRESVEKKFSKVESQLIGVWKFRQRGKKAMWCATFFYDGFYFDTVGKLTVAGALDEVVKELNKIKRKLKT